MTRNGYQPKSGGGEILDPPGFKSSGKKMPKILERHDPNKAFHDPVKRPSHYMGRGGLEAIQVIEAFDLNYHRGNVFKYLVRAGHKDQQKEIEDLQKGVEYLQLEINRLSKS